MALSRDVRLSPNHFGSATANLPAESARANDVDSAVQMIASRALFVHERTPSLPGSGPTVRASAAGYRRLDRWAQACARGDEHMFEKRLAWDGLDVDRAATLMVDQEKDQVGLLPPWAATAGMIMRACLETGPPAPGAAPSGHACDDPPFIDALRPIVQCARQALETRLRAETGGEADSLLAQLAPTAHDQLDRALLTEVSYLSARALYAEFSQTRPAGHSFLLAAGISTTGEPTLGQYNRFVRELLCDGLRQFFVTYPVLARLVAVAVDSWIDATAEFLRRLQDDRDTLAEAFAHDSHAGLGRIVDIEAPLSDPHRGRRVVMGLTFSGGVRIVYKPKDLRTEEAFVQLLGWCNTHGSPLDFKTHRIVARDGYGWVQYIDYRPCRHRRQIWAFYRRAGMLLSLLYVLGSNDCHAENIVASDEHPMLVDMETVMQADPPPLAGDGFSFDSVLRTGLLPRWECHRGTGYLADVSGLGIEALQRVPVRRWRSANTDSMHPVWVLEEVRRFKNTPRPRGESEQLVSVEAAVLSGFTEMYRYILERRAELSAADGPLEEFRSLPVRFLFRATNVYFRILDGALEPEYLRSGTDWSIQLDQLAFAYLNADRRPVAWPILGAELPRTIWTGRALL